MLRRALWARAGPRIHGELVIREIRAIRGNSVIREIREIRGEPVIRGYGASVTSGSSAVVSHGM
jgi:hypothetical protein